MVFVMHKSVLFRLYFQHVLLMKKIKIKLLSAISVLVFLFFQNLLPAQILHVGPGQSYPDLSQAVQVVQPGDTILIHAGTYPGGGCFSNLQGTVNQWITIKNAPGDSPVFEAGGTAFQLTDPAYLRISGLIFQHQTGNGLNIDDGGSYDTPAHHVVFDGCVFRNMNASGNNDLLKLSGLDSFEIRNCQFLNGSPGGSGIDMVGCHAGVIEHNYFEQQGSNSIQAKGGTAWIRIQGNYFKDGGQRALNLGGSTGLQFFRPDTAHYEAAHLQVFSNLFVGSWAPIAYVGAVYVDVVNNTFYKPENWVIRILQETVDPDRFFACGDNSFLNNIIYLDHNLNTETNIGPNTRPETFLFSNNLWFNSFLPNWSGPDTPTPDQNQILNADPLFADPELDNFSLLQGSPAIGSGLAVPDPVKDYEGNVFLLPRSRGALESGFVGTSAVLKDEGIRVCPNPFAEEIFFRSEDGNVCPDLRITVYNAQGQIAFQGICESRLRLPDLPAGIYWLRIRDEKRAKEWLKQVVKR